MRRVLASLALGASLLAAPAIARAADPSPQDVAQARELGGQAQAALDGGKLQDAERLWTAAEGLYPAPTITLGLARTQARLGKYVLAQESYNRILRDPTLASNPSPAFRDALEAARAEVPAVSAKLGAVTIKVASGAATPTVTLDGQPVAAAGLGLARPVDPGKHVLHAEAPGYRPADASFEVASAGKAEASLVLQPAPEAAGGAAAKAGKPGLGTRQKIAIGAFGVGAAGLVLGGVTGIVAIGKHGSLSDACPGGVCPAAKQSDYDSYKTMGTLSTIGFVVGGVGVATGAVLWFTGRKERSPAAASFQPYLGLGGGGVTGTF